MKKNSFTGYIGKLLINTTLTITRQTLKAKKNYFYKQLHNTMALSLVKAVYFPLSPPKIH